MSFDALDPIADFIVGGPPSSGTTILSRVLNRLPDSRITQGLNVYGVSGSPEKVRLIVDPIKYIENISWRISNNSSSDFIYYVLDTLRPGLQEIDFKNNLWLACQLVNGFRLYFSGFDDTRKMLNRADNIHSLSYEDDCDLSQKLEKEFSPADIIKFVEAVKTIVSGDLRIIGDKYPPYGYHLYDLFNLYNDLKFIVNLRHPLSVCRSYLSKDPAKEWWTSSSPAEAFQTTLLIFNRIVNNLKKISDNPENRVYINRIEDVSESPEYCLEKCLDFLIPGGQTTGPETFEYVYHYLWQNFNYEDYDDFDFILSNKSITEGQWQKFEKICNYLGYEKLPSMECTLKPEISFSGSW